MKCNCIFNVPAGLNEIAVDICKFLLFGTSVEQKMYVFVCGDISNKLNLAVYTLCGKIINTIIAYVVPLIIYKRLIQLYEYK